MIIIFYIRFYYVIVIVINRSVSCGQMVFPSCRVYRRSA